MVFVDASSRYYFVGRDIESVLEDTHEGKGFGWAHFTHYELKSPEEIEKLNFEYLDQARGAIDRGTKSFCLAIKTYNM